MFVLEIPIVGFHGAPISKADRCQLWCLFSWNLFCLFRLILLLGCKQVIGPKFSSELSEFPNVVISGPKKSRDEAKPHQSGLGGPLWQQPTGDLGRTATGKGLHHMVLRHGHDLNVETRWPWINGYCVHHNVWGQVKIWTAVYFSNYPN